MNEMNFNENEMNFKMNFNENDMDSARMIWIQRD
jgi:hypothetical protein